MRTLARVTISAAAAAALIVVGALPANAADTTATVEVEGGTLSISAPTTAELPAAAPGATSTVQLAGVTVSDTTADTVGWDATVSITDFVSAADADKSISASAFAYVAAAADVTGTATVTNKTVNGAAGSVQQASAVVGNNTATWSATLSVTLPTDALAASDYQATLTHSVS
jgi:hypothetical protein